MSRGAFEGKKFLVIDRQRVKRLWYITVQFETGEIDILDEKDVEYDEDAPLKAKSKAKNNMSQVFCSLLEVL